MKLITLLIPCHNEEKNIPRLYGELDSFTKTSYIVNIEGKEEQLDMTHFQWQLLFVNDGSIDHTQELLADLFAKDPERVKVINLSRNFGKENALLAGMDYSDGDAVVILDADLQDPVNVIPEMIYWWQQGYDDIYGRRADRGKESHLRKTLSISFYKILQKTTDIDTLPNVGDFRLLDRRAVLSLISMRESQRYTKGLFCWIGYNKKEVMYRRQDRENGKSSYNLIKLMNLAIEGITSYTTAPLRISTIAGLIVSIMAFVYLIFILIKTLVWGEVVTGFPTLICVILFLGGMQLLALGIIGEYIGRIFNETKGRPPYIIENILEKSAK